MVKEMSVYPVKIGASIFSQLAEEWRQLEDTDAIQHIYQTYDWNATWWKHYGNGMSLVLLAARDVENALVGIFPLFQYQIMLKNRLPFVHVTRNLGAPHFDYFDLIIKPGLGSIVVPAFMDYLAGHFPRAIFHLTDIVPTSYLPNSECMSTFFSHRIQRNGFSAPYVELGGQSWESYTASLGKRTRKHIHQSNRQLEKSGTCSFRMETSFSQGSFDEMYRLHYSRWKMSNSDASLSELKAYETEVAMMLSRRNELRLMSLCINDELAAIRFMYDFKRKRYFHKSGFNAKYSHCSPGTLLRFEAIRDGLQRGLMEVDCLRGNEEYKEHFADCRRQLVDMMFSRSRILLLTYKVVTAFSTIIRRRAPNE